MSREREWFDWNDGSSQTTVRLDDVVAIKCYPIDDGVAKLYLRGGTVLDMPGKSAIELKEILHPSEST